MTFILKQSTSASFYMGPFLDLTAGTAEEALTIDATEVWLSKNGGAYANKNEGTAVLHGRSGMWLMVLDATDTSAVGTLSILVDDTANAAIPVALDCQVVETAVYDALYANNATGFNSSGQVALIAATQASIDAIETDTSTTLDTKINTIDTLLDAITAEVVTAQTLPAAVAPPLAPTVAEMLAHMYKAYRNEQRQTATLWSLYNDAGSAVEQKAVVSSDGTTFTREEVGAGP